MALKKRAVAIYGCMTKVFPSVHEEGRPFDDPPLPRCARGVPQARSSQVGTQKPCLRVIMIGSVTSIGSFLGGGCNFTTQKLSSVTTRCFPCLCINIISSLLLVIRRLGSLMRLQGDNYIMDTLFLPCAQDPL